MDIDNIGQAPDFTERFIGACKFLQLPPSTLARILKVTRQQVRDFLSGTATLKEDQVLTLERRAQQKQSALQLLHQSKTPDPTSLATTLPIPILTSEEYFNLQMDNWVASWQRWRSQYPSPHRGYDIFVINPEHLPITEVTFRNRTAFHLRQGADYHFVYVIDGFTPAVLMDTLLNLIRIVMADTFASERPSDRGKLHFHGIALLPLDAHVRNWYDRIYQTNGSALVLHPIVETQQQPAQIYPAIGLGTLPTIATRARIDLESLRSSMTSVPDENFVARQHENVSLKPFGPRITGWIYHAQSDVQAMIARLDSLTLAVDG